MLADSPMPGARCSFSQESVCTRVWAVLGVGGNTSGRLSVWAGKYNVCLTV